MAKIKINALIDEEEILKGFLKDKKTINVDTYRKLIVYTKYLKQQGNSDTQIRTELENLMSDYYVGFVMDDWDDTLKKIVSRYTKKERVEFKKAKNKVHINYEELEFIKSQDNIETEKLMFIMLILAKLEAKEDSESLWVNCDRAMLFTLSRYKFTKDRTYTTRAEQRGSIIYDMIKRGLIDRNRGVTSTGIKLLYGNNINIKEGIDLDITKENVENIIITYLDWRQKEDYYYCKKCGKEIKKTGNRQQYCPSCKKKIAVENVKRCREKTK